jgi:hypothetical protein
VVTILYLIEKLIVPSPPEITESAFITTLSFIIVTGNEALLSVASK